MLLTLKPPIQNGIKGPHEYSIIRQSIPAPRSSSTPIAASSPSTSASAKPSPERAMDNPRGGLPPPSAMTLPPEPNLPAMTAMGQLPPPPLQWHNSDESMRTWLQARSEEDRRRQEEERTRQEGLRLEQRKIEQSMLRDSFQAGVPPHMVPLIFAGLGGSLPRDVAQQLLDPANAHGQSLQRPPPQSSQHQPTPSQLPPPPPPPQPQPPTQSHPLPHEVRRDNRAIPPNPYAAQTATSLPGPPPQVVPPSPTQQPYGLGQPPLLPPPTDSRGPPPSSLSRLNTAEMHIHHLPTNIGVQYQPSAAPPPPTLPAKPETQPQQSPSIYFHHWVPPGQPQPNTPSGKSQQETNPHSHLRPEFQSSPGRKRKAQGSHQPAPPPSQPTQSSPAMSHQSPRHATPGRRGHDQGHLRHQSDTSHDSRYHEYQESDPESAHRQPRPNRESMLNLPPPGPERDHIGSARRASAGPGSEHHRVSAERDEHTQSRYGEPQGPSQPSGYSSYHHSHGSSGHRQ